MMNAAIKMDAEWRESGGWGGGVISARLPTTLGLGGTRGSAAVWGGGGGGGVHHFSLCSETERNVLHKKSIDLASVRQQVNKGAATLVNML